MSVSEFNNQKEWVGLDREETSKYICDRSNSCLNSHHCGGAIPHEFDDNECCKCPMDKDALCILVDEFERRRLLLIRKYNRR